MAENSGIGWTHHTKNFWWGCDKVSAECRLCYIEGIMNRAGVDPWNGPKRTKGFYKNTSRWQRQAIENNTRYRIFTCSMSDFFHPGADDWRDEAWDVIRQNDRLDWLILTKRPELIADRLPANWGDGWANVWLGVTCGCERSKYRLPHLKDIPAAVKFVSAEPLLEEVDFSDHTDWIDWIITGCEQASIDKRSPMSMDWVRNIDAQCRENGVAHYFKQHYAVNDSGDEIGVPVSDGILDGVKVQDYPNGHEE